MIMDELFDFLFLNSPRWSLWSSRVKSRKLQSEIILSTLYVKNVEVGCCSRKESWKRLASLKEFKSNKDSTVGPRFSAPRFSDTPIYAKPDLVPKFLSPEDVTKSGSDFGPLFSDPRFSDTPSPGPTETSKQPIRT
eukprot:sb/3474588/